VENTAGNEEVIFKVNSSASDAWRATNNHSPKLETTEASANVRLSARGAASTQARKKTKQM